MDPPPHPTIWTCGLSASNRCWPSKP